MFEFNETWDKFMVKPLISIWKTEPKKQTHFLVVEKTKWCTKVTVILGNNMAAVKSLHTVVIIKSQTLN